MGERTARHPVGAESEFDALVRGAVRAALGAEVARLEPLAGQLGLRRFARVWLKSGSPATLIARLEAPEDPGGRPSGIAPEPPLEPLRTLLERAGLPVPARYGGDARAGLDLLEDLGSLSLREAVGSASAAERRALYEEACDLVPRLQRVEESDTPVPAFQRRLDAAQFAYKANLFVEWSLRERGRDATPAEVEAVREAFAIAAGEAERAPRRLAHRDLQSENRWVRPGGTPGARLALIDLQGAWLAPPEYDLVCLLRDSYVELPEAEVAAHLDRVRPQLPDAPDPETFARRFDLLTLSRKGKDHARFLYAARARGDRRYLPYAAATLRALRAAAARAAARDPRLAPLAELIGELPERSCAR